MQREPFDPDMIAGPQGVDEETNRLSREIIGAAIEVHRTLGPGYLESMYEEALCHELTLRGIPFLRQHAFAVSYKGHPIGEGRIDLLVGEKVIVELKTVDKFAPIHVAQAMSYLRAMNLKLALLINFHLATLKDGVKRVIV